MSTERIGFVGIGLMGHGMAKNIVEAGYPLTVIAHNNRKPVEDLVGRGAVEAESLAALAQNADVVFLCVTGSPQVEEVIAGPEGLAAHLSPGAVVVDCSTSDPVSTAKMAELLAGRGIGMADAPLSRTPKDAWEGTLDCMVGASDEIFARIRPIVDTWAGKIVHIGGVGDGHKMKLLNNFVSLGYAAVYSEALVLAAKVGISPETFDSVIAGGRMDCPFYQTFRGYAIEGNREAHKLTLSNALKDLAYLESMADAAKIANPLGNATKNAFALAIGRGGDGAEDYVPHLVDFIAEANGAKLRP